MNKYPINVTKPYLPDKKKYHDYIDKIYEANWLTNNGPLVKELEAKLAQHLNVKNIILVSNGTMALHIAYKLLDLKNEIITTPFSFVATTSSLVWDGLKPVFSDINPKTFNIDPRLIESKITSQTSAILPVHVFGNACEVEAIQELAQKHKLKIIYDAAHAFDIQYKDKSIFNYGDVSIVSFHATKLFHTIEGGALIINNDDLYEKAKQLINFGFQKGNIVGIGTNSKMNEFQAAMGLCMLDEINSILEKRKNVWEYYFKYLNTKFRFQELNPNATYNYHYFPIVFDDEQSLLRAIEALNKHSVYPRRYFHPSLDTLDYIDPKQTCAVSRDIASRILCLPIYPDLTEDEQKHIIDILVGIL